MEVMARGGRAEEKEPELPEGVVWRPGERGVLTGTVRNARGTPLEGVTVELVESEAAHGEGHQKVKTGPGGRYRFAPSTMSKGRVSVRVPEYAPMMRVIPLSSWGETAVDIPLQLEVQVAGTVLSAAGPVRDGGGVALWPLPPEGVDMKKWFYTTAQVSSAGIEPEGTFRLQGVPAGEYLLTVRAKGFLPMSRRVRAPDGFLRLQVAKGASVGGRVLTAQGKPMVEVSVRLKPQPGTEQALAQAGASVLESAKTDDQGAFSLPGIPNGDYLLEVITGYGLERVCLQHEVAVQRGKSVSTEVRLGRGPVIRGRVKDAQGRPVKGLEVVGMLSNQTCSIRRTLTGEDGAFVLRDVKVPGRYKLYGQNEESPDSSLRSLGEAEGSMGDSEAAFMFPNAP
jgi:hypothetical protein